MRKETPKNPIENFVSPIGEWLSKRFKEAADELEMLYKGGLKCPDCGGRLTILGWDEHDNTIYECRKCHKEWM